MKKFIICLVINYALIAIAHFASNSTNMFHYSGASFLIGVLAATLNVIVWRS